MGDNKSIKDIILKVLNNSIVNMIMTLAIVGILSGVVLVVVYKYSIPKIKVNMTKETDRAIKSLFPDLQKVEKTSYEGVYKITGSKSATSGYAFIAEGNGYQGLIKLIAGADTGLTKLTGIEVLESQETPGLGAEIANTPFRKQFDGLSITHPIEYVKNEKPDQPYEIEAITGATISSRAVVNILNKKITELRKELGK